MGVPAAKESDPAAKQSDPAAKQWRDPAADIVRPGCYTRQPCATRCDPGVRKMVDLHSPPPVVSCTEAVKQRPGSSFKPL